MNRSASQFDAPAALETDAATGGDPTQRLLTALGRFQRQVARAEAGAEQDQWSDACMDELVAALEISLGENWTEVVEALTGAGRVLQTYEDAGYAHLCVPFLSESYEILCLMVGDLIVGKVRSGVIQKWRTCYGEAVADIEAAGLTLARDDETDEEEATAPLGAAPEEAPADEDGFTSPVEGPEAETPLPADEQETPQLEPTSEPDIEEPSGQLAGLPPLIHSETPLDLTAQGGLWDTEPVFDLQTETAQTFEEVSGSTPLFEAQANAEDDAREDESTQPPEERDELAAIEEDTRAAEEQPPAEATQEPVAVEEPAEEPAAMDDDGIAPEVAGALDALCDDLALFEQVPGSDPSRAVTALREKLLTLEQYARETDREPSAALCQTMMALCELAREPVHGHDDRFLELAYGFCEAYVVANTEPESPVVYDWSVQGRDLIDAWKRAASAATAPGPQAVSEDAAAFQLDDMSLRTLLHKAQRAISDGNVADAKIMMLQAAASLAKIETAKTEACVHEAELRLKEGNASIDAARERVEEAEKRVAEAQNGVAEGRRTANDAEARIARILDTRKTMEQTISQLDARIRELQAQREAEVKRMFEAGIQLDEARQEHTQAEAELSNRTQAEQQAREHHENIRQGVKNLHHKRSELELALSLARETLTRHRSSLLDIEQAIAEIRGDSAPTSRDTPESLF